MARFGSGVTSDREISAIRASQRARKAEARGDHGVALGLHEQAAMTNRRAGRIAEAEQHERAAHSLRQTIAQGGARAPAEGVRRTASVGISTSASRAQRASAPPQSVADAVRALREDRSERGRVQRHTKALRELARRAVTPEDHQAIARHAASVEYEADRRGLHRESFALHDMKLTAEGRVTSAVQSSHPRGAEIHRAVSRAYMQAAHDRSLAPELDRVIREAQDAGAGHIAEHAARDMRGEAQRQIAGNFSGAPRYASEASDAAFRALQTRAPVAAPARIPEDEQAREYQRSQAAVQRTIQAVSRIGGGGPDEAARAARTARDFAAVTAAEQHRAADPSTAARAASASQRAQAASTASARSGSDHVNRYNDAVRQAMQLSAATPHGRGARKGETTHKSAAAAHLRAAAAAEAAGMHDVASRHREVAREHAERKQHHPHLKVLTPVAAAAREQSHPTPRPAAPGPQAVVSGGGTGKRGGQFIIVNGKKLYGKQREAFLSRKR